MLKIDTKPAMKALDDIERLWEVPIAAAVSTLQADVVKGTPVDTNFARASWWSMINGSPATHPNQPNADAPGPAMPPPMPSTLRQHIGGTFAVVNNAVYIEALEYGHSKQAPHGMARIAAAKFGPNLRRFIKGMKKK